MQGPEDNKDHSPVISMSQLPDSAASALILQQQAALRAPAGLKPLEPWDGAPRAACFGAKQRVFLAARNPPEQGNPSRPTELMAPPSTVQCKGQTWPSRPSHPDNSNSVSRTTRQLDQKAAGMQPVSSISSMRSCSNAPSLVQQPDIPGNPDKQRPCNRPQQTSEASKAGPSLSGNPASGCWDDDLLRQAAALAFPMADCDEATLADLLSTPASINWLEDLLAEDAEPAASSITPTAPHIWPAAETVPTVGARAATTQDISGAPSNSWQQQAISAEPDFITDATGMQRMAPAGSLLELELQLSDGVYPDSNFDDLLNNWPPKQAAGEDGLHGAQMPPGIHSFHISPDSWQGPNVAHQAQPGPDAAPDAHLSPAGNSSRSLLPNMFENTSSTPGASDLRVLQEHAQTAPAHPSEQLSAEQFDGTSSDPMRFYVPVVPHMGDAQRLSGTAGATSSCSFAEELTTHLPHVNVTDHSTEVQHGSGVPATSSFEYGPWSHRQIPASIFVNHRADIQPVLCSDPTATVVARPRQKRPRQSSQETSPARTACMQPGTRSSNGHGQSMSMRQFHGHEPDRISNQAPLGEASLANSSFQPSDCPWQNGANVHGGWSAEQPQVLSCLPLNDRAGSNGHSKAKARAAASTPAGLARHEGAMRESNRGPNIRPMVLEHEQHLARLMQELAQPIPGSNGFLLADRLPVLKRFNKLRGICAPHVKFQALYRRNIQTLVPQARWVQLNPALAAHVMSDPSAALSEWYSGMLGRGGKAEEPCTSPSRPLALVEVPMPTLCSLGMQVWARAKNAKYLSRSPRDAASQASLQSIASFLLFCFAGAGISEDNAEGQLAMHGCTVDFSGHAVASDEEGNKQSMLPDVIKLTPKHQRQAKRIWREQCLDLAEVQYQRERILAKFENSGLGSYMQQGMHFSMVFQNNFLLELAVELAENSAIEYEIIFNSARRFHLEVCSPEQIADIYISAFPGCPDKTEMLRRAAEAA